MSTVMLEIPEAYARSFGATDEEALRNARPELAIQMYREGRWGTGRAARFCDMDRILLSHSSSAACGFGPPFSQLLTSE